MSDENLREALKGLAAKWRNSPTGFQYTTEMTKRHAEELEIVVGRFTWRGGDSATHSPAPSGLPPQSHQDGQLAKNPTSKIVQQEGER